MLGEESPPEAKLTSKDLQKSLEQSEMLAVQELMVDMSLEERQKFVE